MREQILLLLKTKFKGGNANILGRVADILAKTANNEEQAKTAVDGVSQDFIDVIEAYGDSRATDAQKTAVQNYEVKHGLKDGKKVEQPKPDNPEPPQPKPDDQNAALLKQLLEQNKQLAERLDRMDGQRISQTRTAELQGIIGKLPANLQKGYQRIHAEKLTDEEWTALKGEVTAEVEAIVKENASRSAVFGRPRATARTAADSNTEQGEATEAEVQAVVDKLNI